MSIDQTADKETILQRLRDDVARLGTQQALAKEIGVHPAYLSDVLKGRRDIGPSILRHYGLVERSVYVREAEAGK